VSLLDFWLPPRGSHLWWIPEVNGLILTVDYSFEEDDSWKTRGRGFVEKDTTTNQEHLVKRCKKPPTRKMVSRFI